MEERTVEIVMPCAICGMDSEPGESLCAACLDGLPDCDGWKEEE